MSDASEKSQREKDNLARIRENQRRSRARRKEYLSELETKLRVCEQNGVGASAEVQAAAKVVLAENRRLRALLGQNGISDAEIDAFELNNVSNGGTYDALPASISLEALIKHRYPCGDKMPLGRSSTSDSQTLASSTPCCPSREPGSAGPLSSGACRTHAHHPQLQQDAHHAQAVWSEAVGASDNTTFSTAPSLLAGHHPSGYTADSDALEDWAQDFSIPDAGVSTSSCSCAEAANMIRDMGGDPGMSLEKELGCDGNDPQCRASSSLVFDMLDRYAQSGIGS